MSTNTSPPDTLDNLEHQVVQVWHESKRKPGTIGQYLLYVRRFYTYCARAHLDPISLLTRVGANAFGDTYVGPRMQGPGSESVKAGTRSALHAWSCALRALGRAVPEWIPLQQDVVLPKLLVAYRGYRQAHSGVAPATLVRDINTAAQFLALLRSRHRKVATTAVADIDAFVMTLSRRLSRRTVSGVCSSLRSFLRFLQVTGRVRRDLAECVMAPRVRPMESPPRALSWSEVRRLMLGVRRDSQGGRRDYAIFLLMATYGLGGGEVQRLRLEDVDWQARTLRIWRPKTGAPVLLPLVPEVARALASYLRHERPSHVSARAIFVARVLPHRCISCSAIRHLVRKYARAAGVTADRLGAHVLRHSYACRQVELGVNPKVLSDILGHRRASSTSVYARIAFDRLRKIGLPVPR